jgi:hypothetical protein
VYHFVLDGMGRPDVIEALTGHRLAAADELRALGFHLVPRARANYVQTSQALSSAINMDYLSTLLPEVDPEKARRAPMSTLLRRGAALELLEAAGYRAVAFRSGYSAMEFGNRVERAGLPWALDEWQTTLWNNTAMPEMVRLLGFQKWKYEYDKRRGQILYALHHAPDAATARPDWVWVHVLCPHPPFIFDERGEPVNADRPMTIGDGASILKKGFRRRDYLEQYARQADYLLHEVAQAARRIRAEDPGAVLLIHGDHGPRASVVWKAPTKTDVVESMSILVALSWPGLDPAKVPDTLSPVNVYRLVFRDVFGADIELLEDRSFFSAWKKPYQYLDVTERVATGVPEKPLEPEEPATKGRGKAKKR